MAKFRGGGREFQMKGQATGDRDLSGKTKAMQSSRGGYAPVRDEPTKSAPTEEKKPMKRFNREFAAPLGGDSSDRGGRGGRGGGARRGSPEDDQGLAGQQPSDSVLAAPHGPLNLAGCRTARGWTRRSSLTRRSAALHVACSACGSMDTAPISLRLPARAQRPVFPCIMSSADTMHRCSQGARTTGPHQARRHGRGRGDRVQEGDVRYAARLPSCR